MQAKSVLVDLIDTAPSSPRLDASGEAVAPKTNPDVPGLYRVIRRNGEVTGFDSKKIRIAIAKAFLAVEGGDVAASLRIVEIINAAANSVVEKLKRRKPGGGTFHIEEIQDQVELCLVRGGHYQVARAYMLYREARSRERMAGISKSESELPASLRVQLKPADSRALRTRQ